MAFNFGCVLNVSWVVRMIWLAMKAEASDEIAMHLLNRLALLLMFTAFGMYIRMWAEIPTGQQAPRYTDLLESSPQPDHVTTKRCI